MYGKRRMLLVTMAALAAGVVLSGLASSLEVLVAGRVVQGVGGALFPLAFGIIRDELPAERVAGRRVPGYPGPGGFTVSLVMMVAVSVAAAVVAASVPLTPRKAGPCSPP